MEAGNVVTFALGFLGRAGLLLAVPLTLALLVAVAMGVWALARAAARRVAGVQRVGGVLFRSDVYYAPNHTWLAAEGADRLRVGLDDLAGKLVPEPTGVELPAPGKQLKKGEVAAVVIAGGRRMEVLAPADGAVAMVNQALTREPALLKDAYAKGWLFELKPADATYTSLPKGDSAAGWLAREGERLTQALERELGLAAADGGELLAPASTLLAEDKWAALVREFIKR